MPSIAAVAAIMGTILIVALVQSNWSFQAQCAKAYPNDKPAAERCEIRLAKGGPMYEENIGYAYAN